MKLHIDPEAPRDILDETGELIATVYNSAAFDAAVDEVNIDDYDPKCHDDDPAAVALARQFAASGDMLDFLKRLRKGYACACRFRGKLIPDEPCAACKVDAILAAVEGK